MLAPGSLQLTSGSHRCCASAFNGGGVDLRRCSLGRSDVEAGRGALLCANGADSWIEAQRCTVLERVHVEELAGGVVRLADCSFDARHSARAFRVQGIRACV